MSTSDAKATVVSWLWASWLRCIASHSPLCRKIDCSFPLTFIVRGDGYPCAGGEWSQLSISIVNMGLWGSIPACVSVIGLAICGDKQMATLATLWKVNIEVRFVHQQLFQRRSGNLFRRHSGGVPAICLNAHWNNLVPTICLCFFRQSSSLWTPNRWSTTPVITWPMFGWVPTPLGCVASLGFHWPHKLGPYTMRPSGTLMPAFGWTKMWSGRLSRIMSSRHLSCKRHRPLKRPAAPWT